MYIVNINYFKHQMITVPHNHNEHTTITTNGEHDQSFVVVEEIQPNDDHTKFKELVFNRINTFRKYPKEFHSLLEQLSSCIIHSPSYDKIQHKHWKYKIERGNFEYLKNYVYNLKPMNELQMKDDIVIPVNKVTKDNFYEFQSQYQFEVSFFTRINEPDFAIVIRCLSNIIEGVFDCGKYDIFNRELKSIGIDSINKQGKEFFATFAFQ